MNKPEERDANNSSLVIMRGILAIAHKHYQNDKVNWLQKVEETLIEKLSPDFDEDELVGKIINSLDNQVGSVEKSRFLLNAFCNQMENGISVNKALYSWVLTSLRKVANGTDANDAFKLQQPPGRKKGTTSINSVQLACYFELLKNRGKTYEQALEICANKFNTVPRNVARIAKRMGIPPVCDEILEEFCTNDYSHLWPSQHS